MVRGALASLLALEDDIEVVAEVERGDGCSPRRAPARVDVALLDIEMPGMDGIAAAALLARELPQTRSLILTTFGRPGYLRRAIESRRRRLPAEGRAGRASSPPRSASVHAGRRVDRPRPRGRGASPTA